MKARRVPVIALVSSALMLWFLAGGVLAHAFLRAADPA
jgi:hypothetical protein